MGLRHWSQTQLDLVCLTWGIFFPISLYVLVTRLYGPNVGFTGIMLLLILVLWCGPPLLLRRVWRRLRRT